MNRLLMAVHQLLYFVVHAIWYPHQAASSSTRGMRYVHLLIYGIFWIILSPLSYIYRCFATYKHTSFLQAQSNNATLAHLPYIIVIGNFTVGGSGKTPILIALANAIKTKYTVGVVTRGYKSDVHSQMPAYLYQRDMNGVATTDTLSNSNLYIGDEPLLIAQNTGLPIAIHPKRWLAVSLMMRYFSDAQHRAQHQGHMLHQQQSVILSDDGLQHYALPRALEIAVIRSLGNGHTLPLGPLREPLRQVDFILMSDDEQPSSSNIVSESEQSINTQMQYAKYEKYAKYGVYRVKREINHAYLCFKPLCKQGLMDCHTSYTSYLKRMQSTPLYAIVTAIASTNAMHLVEAFKNQLQIDAAQLTVHQLPDHADDLLMNTLALLAKNALASQRLKTDVNVPVSAIFITEKDACKVHFFLKQNAADPQLPALFSANCLAWLHEHLWVIPLDVELPATLINKITELIEEKSNL